MAPDANRTGGLRLSPITSTQLDRRCADMLFQVLTQREKPPASPSRAMKASRAGPKTFTDPRLRAAIIEGQNLQGRANFLCQSAADLP
jgi:hypothetical protein